MGGKFDRSAVNEPVTSFEDYLDHDSQQKSRDMFKMDDFNNVMPVVKYGDVITNLQFVTP